MAFISGSVNAGGLMACNRFVTHVTGFATLFGMDAASGHYRLAIGMLSVPLYFLIGVMAAGYFTDTAIMRGEKPRFKEVMLAVAGLLIMAALLGYFGLFGEFETAFVLEAHYALLVMLSVASGLQNAVLTTASGGVVRSTHLTGITTDLGMGLVRAAFARKRKDVKAREYYRNWLRFANILGFIAGSLVGALLFHFVHYLGFLLPGLLSLYVGDLGVHGVPTLRPLQVGAAET